MKYLVPTRTLTSRVEAPCLTCRRTIPVGTVVWWAADAGIWCITCDAPPADQESPQVEFPPDCPKCMKPVVDPVPSPVADKREWCRACVTEWEAFMARLREAALRRAGEVPKTKPELPANIGGEGYGF